MLDLFKSWLDAPEAGEKISPELAAAALMFEVVWADHEVEAQELALLADQLKACFSLSDEQIQTLTDAAKDLHHDAVGLHEFTQVVNEHLDAEEKYQVVLAMWRIAFADLHLDPLEEHMIRRAADLLYVPHKRFIAAKMAARES